MTRPKLLLADDSVTIRKVVELTFADEGIDVSTVGDSQAAMQKFVEIQPDIVLVDVGLAGTSGYQICEMIKRDEATKHIPVLLLVGSFEPFDQDEAERSGADGFLTKPFHSIRDLVERVWDLIGHRPYSGAEPEVMEISTVTPETADIENLYRTSFADTVEIEEFDTVDDILGDAGMDDEMIEASYPTETYESNLQDISHVTDNAEQSKEFDWSVESMVTERPSAAPVKSAFEPKFTFDESGEHPVEPANDVESPPTHNLTKAFDFMPAGDDLPVRSNTENENHVTIAIEAGGIDIPPVAENVDLNKVNESEWLNPFVLSVEEEDPVLGVRPKAFESQVVGEVDKTVDGSADSPLSELFGGNLTNYEPSIPESLTLKTEDSIPESGADDRTKLPSPEYIAMIAQRVVEHLSDKVIREIAQDAVPQIAEKLIREALEEGHKG